MSSSRCGALDESERGAALFITSRNCDLVLGLPWRAALQFAQAHGIEVIGLGPHKRMIAAADLVRAIRTEHAAQRAAESTVEDRLRAQLRRHGYEPAEQSRDSLAADEEHVDALLRRHGYEPVQ